MTSTERRSRTRSKWQRSPWRIAGFILVVTLAIGALVGRLVQVQLVDGERYRMAAQANQVRLIQVAAPRGIIYDRHGVVLIRSRPSFVVGVIPSEITDAPMEIAALSHAIGMSRAVLWKRLLHHRGLNYRSFDEVQTYEPYGPVVLASDLPVATVARVSEMLEDLPGIDLE